jgi:hypothetical protein
VGLRACEAVAAVFQQDADSLRDTAGLVQQKVDAGFDAPANAALARASAAEAANRVVAQRADCDVAVKQLVALRAQPEADLRQRLAERHAQLPRPAAFAVEVVPARLLAQRPDVAAAERNVAAASADVGTAQADRIRAWRHGFHRLCRAALRWPDLDGLQAWSSAPRSDCRCSTRAGGARGRGPPEARYDQAVAAYRERVLAAVREVEESLVRLSMPPSAARRMPRSQHRATRSIFPPRPRRSGSGHRQPARPGAGTPQRPRVERQPGPGAARTVTAWVALYKAVGGGWKGQAQGDGQSTASGDTAPAR